MALTAGAKLGAYEVIAKLGEGGMGEVYRARDTKLGRHVALKLLPVDAAADPERLARFEREARTLAGLDHPSIVTIHAVDEAAGVHFIAMGLVEGRTLGDVQPANGFPLERLLAIATQIADAVATAHQHGIVHRDLKPGNIMVGAHDRIIVLDFGIAKLCDPAAQDSAALPATQEATADGRILGTFNYMSPEQAQGLAVDARSDVFSLGIVLHEMATGTRPFDGDTSVSVLSAILKDSPPPVSRLKPDLPRDLSRIVRRCLAKEPDRRYQSAVDLRNDLEDLKHAVLTDELAAAAAPVAPAARYRMWPALTATAVVVALAAIGWAVMRRGPGFEPPPPMTFSQLTLLEGAAGDPVISPDGKWVAYVSGFEGTPDIYLQSTAGRTPINLTKDQALDSQPAFSRDGERIAFRSTRDGGGLFVMGRTGESIRRLAPTGTAPAWFPDGRQIVYATLTSGSPETRGGGRSALWIVDTNGGEPRQLFAGDAVQPQVSPNGRRIAYYAIEFDEAGQKVLNANRDLWTIAVDGTGPVRLTDDIATDWNPVWSPDGRWLYFLSNRSGSMSLWRLPIDEGSGRATGAMQSLQTPAPYIRNFSLSADGRMASYGMLTATNNVARVRFDAQTATTQGAVERITTGQRDFGTFDVSANGQQILVAPSFRQQEDLYLMAADGTGLVQLTNDAFKDRGAMFMPDGRRIVFYSDRGGNYDLWSIDRDGSGLRRLTTTQGRYWPVPSPDGARMATAEINAFQLFIHDASDFSKAPELLPNVPDELRGGTLIPAQWSPDGKTLAIISNPHLFLYAFDTKQYRRVAGVSSISADWLPDGRRLLHVTEGRVMVVDTLTGGQPREVFAIPGEVIGRAVHADKWLYVLSGTFTGDVWTIRFGEPGVGSPVK